MAVWREQINERWAAIRRRTRSLALVSSVINTCDAQRATPTVRSAPEHPAARRSILFRHALADDQAALRSSRATTKFDQGSLPSEHSSDCRAAHHAHAAPDVGRSSAASAGYASRRTIAMLSRRESPPRHPDRSSIAHPSFFELDLGAPDAYSLPPSIWPTSVWRRSRTVPPLIDPSASSTRSRTLTDIIDLRPTTVSRSPTPELFRPRAGVMLFGGRVSSPLDYPAL